MLKQNMIKVLVISHASLVDYWREKLDLIARYPDIKLSLLVPRDFPLLEKDSAFKGATPINEWKVDYKVFSGSTIFKKHLTKFMISTGIISAILEKPDIIDIELGPWSFLAGEAIFMKKLFSNNSKIIFRAVEGFRKDKFFDKAAQAYAYAHADLAFAITQRAKKWLRKKRFTKPIELIPNFVNTDVFKRLDIARDQEKPVVGYIGRFVPEKGISGLVQAMAGLKANLLFIGDGPEKKTLKELVTKYKIRSRFMDFIPHKDLPYYINLMDILVLPSITLPHWEEYFGRILIEAMSCKTPVIGSTCGAIPEIIGEAGLIFQENNVMELKKSIKILMDDKDRRREFGLKGRRRVEENFSIKVVSEKIYQAYKNLLRSY